MAIFWRPPPNWDAECRDREGMKSRDFRPISRFISEMIQEWQTISKSYVVCRMAPSLMTLSDLEWLSEINVTNIARSLCDSWASCLPCWCWIKMFTLTITTSSILRPVSFAAFCRVALLLRVWGSFTKNALYKFTVIITDQFVVTSDRGGGKCDWSRLSVCLLTRLLKNACMDLDEILRVDKCRDMDELINFWARSGS